MRARRPAGSLAVLLLVLAGLAGCASETERYCSELEDQQEALTDLATGSDEAGETFYPDLLEIWEALRAEAPGDLADEWSTLVFSLEGFLEAVEATGVTADELDPENPPEGVSEAQVKSVRDAAAELASPRVLGAAEAVQQHARDVCKTDLGITGRGRS